MDYQFPRQLFPSFYNCGPPALVRKHSGGNWGCYDRVRAEGGPGPTSTWTFPSKHQVRGEAWRHSEPVPVPLLTPKSAFLWPSTPPDPLDFRDHMQNFFMDHSPDAFGCMSDILSENFNFKKGRKELFLQKRRRDSVKMGRVQNFVDLLNFNICQQTFQRRTMKKYSVLLWDAVHAIPPELLGSLLHEELTEQRDRLLFCEGATGGALAFVPFSESGSSSQHGCLLYPGNKGLDCLNFHKVELQHHSGSPSVVDASSSKPFSFQLRGPIRQISVTSLFNDCCVAVRSDHFCGVWRFSERNEPRSLQVVNTTEVATCISVSPHVLGEVLVASKSGAANLWTVGKGMQRIREEDTNLYFNARSSWRWCEFSAHPRVMLYADRTGAELSDLRVGPASGHTLFRISSTSECQSGERLILSRYLGDVHPFHHLVTTQYSAYIMDERFPCVPMLKWDHMMQAPPVFCHVVPSSSDSGTTKVLLGSHSSQEITLLQYSGGRAEASSSRGPPQALLRPRDSLEHLPVQLPHRHDIATNRLILPAAGLTCIQKKAGGVGASGQECMCVLQLTEAGDIFYQILEPVQPGPSSSQPPAAEDEVQPQQRSRKLQQAPLKEAAASGRNASEQLPPGSQQTVSDTSSDEGIIGPTQGLYVQETVAETPEREGVLSVYSDSDSEDSESRGKSRSLRRLQLQVVVNEDPELDPVSGLDNDVGDGNKGKDETDDREERHDEQETVNSSSSVSRPPRETSVKLSSSALVTWKHWLQKLMQKSSPKTPRPRRLQHFTVPTEGLLHGPDKHAKDSSEKKRLHTLRKDLRSSMTRRSLLVNSSTSVGAPGLVPLPNQVDPEAWTDALSQRLTLSWQEGEEAWRAWWEDKLGMNKEAKVQALRRKRRKEKEARRATGHRFDLSGSFTSTVSYQSELDDFSSSGWSSGPSQREWSDTEPSRRLFHSALVSNPDTPTISTPSHVQNDTLVPTPTNTPRSGKEKQGEQLSPSRSRILSPSPRPDSTPASQRRSKRPADDYLSSLFPPQEKPSQSDSCVVDAGSTMQPPPLHAASSQSVPVRSVRVDLSQSLSLSQSSQARQGPSQSSQPKKKKSRMGF